MRVALDSRLVGRCPAKEDHMTLLSLVEVSWGIQLGVRPDMVYGSAGPGGYVAAIKAAQLGLRVRVLFSCSRISHPVYFFPG